MKRVWGLASVFVWFAACGQLPRVVLVDPAAPPAEGNPRHTPQDGGVTQGDGGAPLPHIGAACFPEVWHPELPNPFYEQFYPQMGGHCAGTHHQDIRNVERVVFLGDSITAGTPPTLPNQLYRALLTEKALQRWPGVVVDDCSVVGARSEDLLVSADAQIPQCFTQQPDARATLVIMTMGGNDMADMQRAGSAGASPEESVAAADRALQNLDAALAFLKDPARFPGGSFVVFANLYEYTDGTNDVASCPAATVAGITGMWAEGEQTFIRVNQGYMERAVGHQADMVLLMEHFCGHGYHNNDPQSRCYRGPNAARWFDVTCIHPTPAGHRVVADLFWSVVLGDEAVP